MKKSLLYSIAILSVIGTGCAKLQEESSFVTETSVYFPKSDEPLFVSSHDIQMNDLAKAVNLALRSDSGMREFVHSESLLRFDGDYDFLLSRAMDKPVADSGSKTRSGSGAVTFGEMLEGYLPETRSGEDFLASIQELYPDLQVAIPVHAEEWDPATYTPAVVFLPEDYKEFVTQVVPGYDAEGDYIEVDAIHAPDVPVIVISHNERMERMPNDVDGLSGSPVSPPPPSLSAPTNLTASTTNNGIVLSWQFSGGGRGFKVWRKGAGETSYTTIATLPGLTNLGYQDTSVQSGYTYQYYVTSYYESYNSSPSNIVTAVAPVQVSALTSFKVLPSGLNLNCEWAHGQASYADVVVEHKGPYDSNFSQLVRKTDWGTNYVFTPSNRGMRHEFRAYRDNGNSQSDALTDYVYPPYRNTAAISNVYVKKIKYSGMIEGWLQGEAEFDIIATYYNEQTQKVCADSMFVRTESEAILNGRLLKRWAFLDAEKDWYSVVTIHMIEQDPGDDMDFSLAAKSSFKLFNIVSVETETKYTHKGRDDDDECGHVDLYYFDNPEMTLQFPNYSVELTISQNS